MKAFAKKNFIVFSRALFFLFLGLLLCQSVEPVRLPLKSHTTSEGLAHDRVNRMARDSRGFLWFCTSEGLSRFDGSEFKNYTQKEGLPHRSVQDFLETRDGNIWIATGDGAVLFNPLGESPKSKIQNPKPKIEMFRVFRDETRRNDRQAWTVYDLVEDRNGIVWAATVVGLYRLEKNGEDWQLSRVETERWGHFNSKDFTSVLEDRTGAIWVGAGRGLFRLLTDGTVQGLDRLLRVGNGTILEDRAGRIWVGTNGGESRGLYQYALTEGKNEAKLIRVFDSRDGLSSDNWMNSLLETRDGRIFVGVASGVCEFKPNGAQDAKPFQKVFAGSIISLAEDESGNLWVGTISSGALRIARRGFVGFDEEDGLKSKGVSSIVKGSDGETYVIAGNHTIHRFDGERFTVVSPQNMMVINWSMNQITFQDRGGEWWVAAYEGLQRYPRVERLEDLARTKPKRLYTTADGLYVNGVFQLFEDSRGDLWLGLLGNDLKNTVQRWERATDRVHSYTTDDGFPAENCPTAFGEDFQGNVWMGFYGGGLGRFRDGKFEMFTAEDGVPSGFIRDIHTDRAGRIWVATVAGGVIRIDNPAEEKPEMTNLTVAEGLASNQANCIAEDDFGRIYIGTGRGVNRIDLEKNRIRLFTKADGLPENLITLCQADAGGAVWFATNRGVARYVPAAEEKSAPPPVFIGSLRVNGEPALKVSELGETLLENLDFESDQRQIQIEFFALGFSTGDALSYQYKFAGADWSEPTDQRSVNLNLAPGSYSFEVRAVNSEGAASERPARVSFSIARPVWQRWWFLALAALAVSGVIYALYRYRLKRLLELEKVRTRIATDLHDDIGASLSKIAILSEIVGHQIPAEQKQMTEPLKSIAGTSREMVDSMSDIVWAINPAKDHLSDLAGRMRNLAGEMTELRDIRLKVNTIGLENFDLTIGADLRREVYLIFKECLNNLVKHSACDTAEIEFALAGENLIISVKDNGKGFEEGAKNGNENRGGNGLPNMKRRAANLGGSFEIHSETGKGTAAVLCVPVKSGKLSLKNFFRGR